MGTRTASCHVFFHRGTDKKQWPLFFQARGLKIFHVVQTEHSFGERRVQGPGFFRTLDDCGEPEVSSLLTGSDDEPAQHEVQHDEQDGHRHEGRRVRVQLQQEYKP